MKIRAYILVVVVLLLFIGSQARADSTATREYQVKAAFLYNFIKFVDWPKEKTADSNEPIIIGIIGNDPFGDAFDAIKDKQVKDRKIVINRFKGLDELEKSTEKHPQIEGIRECHLLFICRSQKQNLTETINLVKDHSVLTVGDMEGFLESGGIINFVMKREKVRFEINITAAKGARLKIRSQLLRLAKRVVEEKPSDKEKS
jgi:hypothetical protein